jgi:hypothetical protein
MMRIKKSAMNRADARTRAAVQKHDGLSGRIARLLPIHMMLTVENKHATVERLNTGKQFAAVSRSVHGLKMTSF